MPKNKTPIDVEIGQAIRSIRTAQGVSQEQLGEALGVTFQQVQKYEKGTNRLSVSSLIRLCKALNVSPVDVIGPQIGAPSESTALAGQVAGLKQRLAQIRALASERV
jgi:transcriptional regulator with XRE-family HTH domain